MKIEKETSNLARLEGTTPEGHVKGQYAATAEGTGNGAADSVQINGEAEQGYNPASLLSAESAPVRGPVFGSIGKLGVLRPAPWFKRSSGRYLQADTAPP